jgi:hypothetical protein
VTLDDTALCEQIAESDDPFALDINLHERQTYALETLGTEVLYGGAAGGGKSHLMRGASVLWSTMIPGLQTYLFRRKFPDLYKNHMEGPNGYPNMLARWVQAGWAKINYSENAITFPFNGAKIHLCHLKDDKNMYDYQGAEIHVLLMDELTHFSEPVYRYLRGRVRLGGLVVPPELKHCFPRILAGSNPGGIGHNFVKKTFITPAEPFALVRQPPSEGGLLRQYIPAKLSDNPTMAINDPDYIHRLEGLGNPALVKAMKDGDWNIVAGGALDDVWNDRIKMPRFTIPSSWRLDRSLDWGSAKPFSVLWYAQADGTEAILPNGRRFCPPRDSIIVIHEWYGARGVNEGLKMPAKSVARGILDMEQSLKTGQWIQRPVRPGPADNSIADTQNPKTPTIADDMGAKGVRWEKSDKKPGSRKIGLELMRTMLAESGKDHPEDPCLYIFDHCRNLLEHLPVLQRDEKDPEDVDSKQEDHDYDSLRYRVLKGSSAAELLEIKLPS